MSKKWWLLSLLAVFVMVVAVACGDDDDDDDDATEEPQETETAEATEGPTEEPTGDATGSATAAPTEDGGEGARALPDDAAAEGEQVINVGLPAEPDFIDPHKSQFEQDIAIERLLFRGLLYTDAEGTPIPAVASEVPSTENGGISEDLLTYTFTIENQMWSDGEPLTATDMEFALKRAMMPETASPYVGLLYNVVGAQELNTAEASTDALMDAVGVTAIDEETLEITIKQPQATFNLLIGLWFAYPVREDVVAQGDSWTEPGNLIGNGPFLLEARTEGASFTLTRNDNYTAGDMPFLEQINVTVVEDRSTGFDAWQTGELDIMELSAARKPVVDGDPELQEQFILGPNLGTRGLQFQHEVEPLNNPLVRQAMSHAIDRERYVEVVWLGLKAPGANWLPPGVPGHDPEKESIQAFDPELAQQLLAEAGYPGGEGFPTLSIMVRDDPTFRADGEFIQNALQEVLGITVELDVVDSQTRSSRFSNSQYEMMTGGWLADYNDPENFLVDLWRTGGTNNKYKYSNAEFDALMDEALSAADDEARIGAYMESEQIWLEDVAMVPIYYETRPTMVNTSKVGGLEPNALDAGWMGSFSMENVYILAES